MMQRQFLPLFFFLFSFVAVHAQQTERLIDNNPNYFYRGDQRPEGITAPADSNYMLVSYYQIAPNGVSQFGTLGTPVWIHRDSLISRGFFDGIGGSTSIEAGAGIIVSGTGTEGDPYIITNTGGGGGDNIYTTNGTVLADRTVTAQDQNTFLNFKDFDYVNISNPETNDNIGLRIAGEATRSFDNRLLVLSDGKGQDSIIFYRAYIGGAGGFDIISTDITTLQAPVLVLRGTNSELSVSNGIFTDGNNSRGLAYAADYSANYGNRSIPDVEYVNDQVSGVNTIYNQNGTVSTDRTVTVGTGNSLNITTQNGDGQIFMQDGTGLQISGNTSTTGGRESVTFPSTGGGMQYQANYNNKAGFGDRSIPDWGYISTHTVDTLSSLSDTTAAANNVGRIVHAVDVDQKWTVNSAGVWEVLSGGDSGTDDQTAAEVPTTPTGNFTSTNAQAGFEEHQSDIDALASGYQGVLNISDSPASDGYYLAGETGTFTNAGNVVSDLSQGINIISKIGASYSIVTIPYTGVFEYNTLKSQLRQSVYDGSFISDTWVSSSGGINSFLGINMSERIDVKGLINKPLLLTARPNGVSAQSNIAMYDENDSYIGNINAGAGLSLFEISDTTCRYIRFNVKWVTDTQQDVFLYVSERPEKEFLSSNDRFKPSGSSVLLSGIASVNRESIINSQNVPEGVEFYAQQNSVTLIYVDSLTSAVESHTIRANIGYNYIPASFLPETSLTNYYIGFSTGIYYDPSSISPSYFVSGAAALKRYYLLSYNVLYREKQLVTDFEIAALTKNNRIISGSYTLDSSVSFPDGFSINGSKCTVTVGSDAKISLSKNSQINNVNFKGSRSNSLNAYISPQIDSVDLQNYSTYIDRANSLIEITGGNTSVNNCLFENIDKNIILMEGDNYASANQPGVYKNTFINCRSAVVNTEYCNINDNRVFNCDYGFIIEAGNTYMTGNMLHNNACAVVINDIVNGGHGSFVGGSINHNSVMGVYVLDLNTSFIFSGVNIFDANIAGIFSEGLVLSGCIIDNNINITAGATNMIVGSIFRSGWQGGLPRITDPNNTLSLKNNLIQSQSDHTSVNN